MLVYTVSVLKRLVLAAFIFRLNTTEILKQNILIVHFKFFLTQGSLFNSGHNLFKTVKKMS